MRAEAEKVGWYDFQKVLDGMTDDEVEALWTQIDVMAQMVWKARQLRGLAP